MCNSNLAARGRARCRRPSRRHRQAGRAFQVATSRFPSAVSLTMRPAGDCARRGRGGCRCLHHQTAGATSRAQRSAVHRASRDRAVAAATAHRPSGTRATATNTLPSSRGAAHERAEALEKAVRRHDYAVEMAANNGDVGIANWSGRAAAHAREGACLPLIAVTPEKTAETYGWILFPWC